MALFMPYLCPHFVFWLHITHRALWCIWKMLKIVVKFDSAKVKAEKKLRKLKAKYSIAFWMRFLVFIIFHHCEWENQSVHKKPKTVFFSLFFLYSKSAQVMLELSIYTFDLSNEIKAFKKYLHNFRISSNEWAFQSIPTTNKLIVLLSIHAKPLTCEATGSKMLSIVFVWKTGILTCRRATFGLRNKFFAKFFSLLNSQSLGVYYLFSWCSQCNASIHLMYTVVLTGNQNHKKALLICFCFSLHWYSHNKWLMTFFSKSTVKKKTTTKQHDKKTDSTISYK